MEDPDDEDVIIKCQPSYNDAPFRELISYHHFDHPNIPKIWDVEFVKGITQKFIHFKMNRYTPLKEYIEENDLDIETKREIFLDILKAVSYLQSRSVYHQDVRVDNVLIDTNVSPIKAYLCDFGFVNDTFTARAGWVDYIISEYYYNHRSQPPLETMLDGDCWSLGLFGVYLFCDEDIYNWARGVDDECMDIVYFIRGRFGSGLHNAHLNLEDVPEDILEMIKVLMDDRIGITNGYEYDPIDFDEFNQSDKLEYVKNLMNISEIDQKGIDITKFIEEMRAQTITDKEKAIAVI
ncbi:unnamed protein product, partial [marine sediment metagenome]